MSKATVSDVQKMVDESYVDDVRTGLCSRKCWKITGDVCETLGQLLLCFAASVSYAAGVWPEVYLAYIAGTMCVISLGFHRFGTYAKGESKERTDETNRLLATNNITPLVDITTITENVEDPSDVLKPKTVSNTIPTTTASSTVI